MQREVKRQKIGQVQCTFVPNAAADSTYNVRLSSGQSREGLVLKLSRHRLERGGLLPSQLTNHSGPCRVRSSTDYCTKKEAFYGVSTVKFCNLTQISTIPTTYKPRSATENKTIWSYNRYIHSAMHSFHTHCLVG